MFFIFESLASKEAEEDGASRANNKKGPRFAQVNLPIVDWELLDAKTRQTLQGYPMKVHLVYHWIEKSPQPPRNSLVFVKLQGVPLLSS